VEVVVLVFDEVVEVEIEVVVEEEVVEEDVAEEVDVVVLVVEEVVLVVVGPDGAPQLPTAVIRQLRVSTSPCKA
jgi:hypothetical protein